MTDKSNNKMVDRNRGKTADKTARSFEEVNKNSECIKPTSLDTQATTREIISWRKSYFLKYVLSNNYYIYCTYMLPHPHFVFPQTKKRLCPKLHINMICIATAL